MPGPTGWSTLPVPPRGRRRRGAQVTALRIRLSVVSSLQEHGASTASGRCDPDDLPARHRGHGDDSRGPASRCPGSRRCPPGCDRHSGVHGRAWAPSCALSSRSPCSTTCRSRVPVQHTDPPSDSAAQGASIWRPTRSTRPVQLRPGVQGPARDPDDLAGRPAGPPVACQHRHPREADRGRDPTPSICGTPARSRAVPTPTAPRMRTPSSTSPTSTGAMPSTTSPAPPIRRTGDR